MKTEISSLPNDVKQLIVQSLTAIYIACDIVEKLTGLKAEEVAADVGLAAQQSARSLTEQDYAKLLLGAQELMDKLPD